MGCLLLEYSFIGFSGSLQENASYFKDSRIQRIIFLLIALIYILVKIFPPSLSSPPLSYSVLLKDKYHSK